MYNCKSSPTDFFKLLSFVKYKLFTHYKTHSHFDMQLHFDVYTHKNTHSHYNKHLHHESGIYYYSIIYALLRYFIIILNPNNFHRACTRCYPITLIITNYLSLESITNYFDAHIYVQINNSCRYYYYLLIFPRNINHITVSEISSIIIDDKFLLDQCFSKSDLNV